MWWNFLNNLDEIIIWLIAIIFFGSSSMIGIIAFIRWFIKIFN